MMFDPPDYPYRDLNDSYDSVDLLYNSSNSINQAANIDESLVNDCLTDKTAESQIIFQTNYLGRHNSTEDPIFTDNSIIDQSFEVYLSQPEVLLNSPPCLLDENTVNQFLLPLENSAEKKENYTVNDLALNICVICNESFIEEVDLLDHAISVHSSNALDHNQSDLQPNIDVVIPSTEENNNDVKFGTDWLLCGICERVLSQWIQPSEMQPAEPLCCLDQSGKSNVIIRSMVTMFVCDCCNGLFASGEALERHRITCIVEDTKSYFTEEVVEENKLTSTSQQPAECYFCDTCSKQYTSSHELNVHSLECQRPRAVRRLYTNNTKNKMWNCGSCNQLFVTARELYRHKRGEDRPEGAPLKSYVCEECDKVLGSICALYTHKKMHKVSKPPYPCQLCGRRFNQSGHLAIHMRMHTGERPYPCDLCPKAFKVKVERDDHRRTHTGERPYACNVCPKTFTAAARLREHARIHTDQRPYRCDICGAAFRRPYARTVHTLIHTGEKPHACDICGNAFRRSGDMWKHKRIVHGIIS